MKGYVEIPAERVIEAINNYEAKKAAINEKLDSIKERLEGIVHKGWFYSHTEWDNCNNEGFGWPNWKYIEKNHPELSAPYRKKFFGSSKDTSKIKALALEGVFENVLCDEELSLFVMENA